ncbi:TIGR03013 family XrtA/PEP-CTERM system glycosyltransferase [Luteithermobacter gelatinilyticus]|uniref:TIGR03013 family XrtA/PEP-CTERM system glycosyltransferase n=1 Tax=Luteithermobacter gelatinilyticus TaxID=2582913 RepID=UPI0011069428|nr:TIGR03013 family XrtA/PEP-CTERM system glycosyltransferase [Luteithermobacter gelatinilyticus]
MIRIFKHYIPKPLLYLGMIECLILFAAIWAGMHIRFSQVGMNYVGISGYAVEMGSFVVIVYVVMVATGLYQLDTCRDMRLSLLRLVTGLFLALVAMSVIIYLFPDIDLWRSVMFYAFVFSGGALTVSRFIFQRVADMEQFKKNVLVLGAGDRALEVKKSGQGRSSHVKFSGFLRMDDNENAIPEAIPYESLPSLQDFVHQNHVQEIVVAIQERRGTLPVDALLDCRMDGCEVTDSSSFIEQQTGTLNLDTISPGWLIFADGFGGGKKFDLALKRLFDISASLLVLLSTMPILILTAILVKTTSRGPIFYRQQRVGLNGKYFDVMKFRSMTMDAEKDGIPQWAGKNDSRVTAVGRVIRTTRIDEIPQVFNVLRGDMSFVGPRPERPYFVEKLGKKIPYYHERHRVKPGITGWAQLNYPYGASEEDARRKLEYDLYYIKNYSVFLDFLILIQTVRVVLWPDGVR